MKKCFRLLVICFFFLILCSCDETKQICYLDNTGNIIYETTNNLIDLSKFPIRKGYVVKSYDESEKEGVIYITPLYELATYQLIFRGFDGNIIGKQQITINDEILTPTPIPVTGYHFIGWDHNLKDINSDLEIRALYEKNSYTITYYDEKKEIIETEQVYYEESATPFTLENTLTHQFIGWETENKEVPNLEKITMDYELYPIYQVKSFEVNFYDYENNLIKSYNLNYGESVPVQELADTDLYIFTKWDQENKIVSDNMNIYPIYITKQSLRSYVNYQSSFNLTKMENAMDYLNQEELGNRLEYTFTDIYYGGFRDTNQIHVYDASNYRTRNAYGYEAAVNKDGFIIDLDVNVTLPEGGYIISGHGNGGDLINSQIQLGYYAVHDKTAKTITVYQNNIGDAVALELSIKEAIISITKANDEFLALDYEQLINHANEAINLYNGLLTNYKAEKVEMIKKLLVEISFMLIETNGIETRSFWHYPLRVTGYPESNLEEVKAFLLKVKEMGFNRIITNTNFNGGCCYKSDYLIQKKASSNTYTGYKDYLECFIEEAHKLGIEVCAWTNTLICGDGTNNTFYSSRGWVQKCYDETYSVNGMYYVDISNKDVQEFLGNVYYELANEYNLDGIEFDFIRFPSSNLYSFTGVIADTAKISDAGYTDCFINSFIQKYELTITKDQIKETLRNEPTIRAKWLAYKEELITSIVKLLVGKIKETKPKMIISVACMPKINGAINTYSQNWLSWVKSGLVDTLEPMVYSGSTSYVMSTIDTFYATVNKMAFMNIGIYPEGDGATEIVSAEQISYLTTTYNLSWAKFSSRTIFSRPNWISGITLLQRDYLASNNQSLNALIYAYAYNTYDLVHNYYQYRDTTFDYQTIDTTLYKLLISQSTEESIKLINQIEQEINQITNSNIKNNLTKDTNQVKSFLK